MIVTIMRSEVWQAVLACGKNTLAWIGYDGIVVNHTDVRTQPQRCCLFRLLPALWLFIQNSNAASSTMVVNTAALNRPTDATHCEVLR
jgi:hypothetical protein